MLPDHWKLPKLSVVNAALVFAFHIMCPAAYGHPNPGPAYESMQTEDGWEGMKKVWRRDFRMAVLLFVTCKTW